MTVEISQGTKDMLTAKGLVDLLAILRKGTTVAECMGDTHPTLWQMKAEMDVPIVEVSAPICPAEGGPDDMFRVTFFLTSSAVPGIVPGQRLGFIVQDGTFWSASERHISSAADVL